LSKRFLVFFLKKSPLTEIRLAGFSFSLSALIVKEKKEQGGE